MQTPGPQLQEIEAARPLSQSLLWGLAARAERDAAWRFDAHGGGACTSPVLAAAQAEAVFALLQDQQRLGRWPAPQGQPLRVCELGARDGEFAFHFLRHLARLCEGSGVAASAFRYTLADAQPARLRACEAHPKLMPFLRSGVLDTAVFDPALPQARGGIPFADGGLELPLVLVANEVLGALPQDLLALEDGRAWQVRVALDAPAGHERMDAAQLLGQLQPRLERSPLAADAYAEGWLNTMAQAYRASLQRAHVLLPVGALRCLEWMGRLAPAGMLLLSADRGSQALVDLPQQPPRLLRSGRLALEMNQHALRAYAEQHGGQAWFPASPRGSVATGTCLLGPQARRWHATRRVCEDQASGFGPGQALRLIAHADTSLETMDVPALLAFLRMGRHDARQCLRYIPRLRALLPGATARDVACVLQALEDAWQAEYPLPTEPDLAHALAGLYFDLADYARALACLKRSAQRLGMDGAIAVRMARCELGLGRPAAARKLLQHAQHGDSLGPAAAALLAQCMQAASHGCTP